ncbi:MAG: alpha/beta hydrolase [Thermoproteota archaeon]|nr:alpha/beta hydrolase [Thermoproteota archaeon]
MLKLFQKRHMIHAPLFVGANQVEERCISAGVLLVIKQPTPQKFTNVNGYRIRYLEVGSPNRKILILLHGIGASAERWSHVIPGLSKYFHLIIPDIIGFGYSDKPAVDYTMDFFVDFFRSFLDNLGITKASIIGSSFGGHVATEFAIRFNHMVEKLILVSPAGMMRKSSPTLDRYIMAALYPEYQRVYEAFSEMVYDSNAINQEILMDFMNRMNLPNAKYAFMSTLLGIRYAPDLRGRFSNITAPTLLVWGDDDTTIPLAEYSNLYKEIPNMDEIVMIKNCRHIPPVEKPATFNSIALRFLMRPPLIPVTQPLEKPATLS